MNRTEAILAVVDAARSWVEADKEASRLATEMNVGDIGDVAKIQAEHPEKFRLFAAIGERLHELEKALHAAVDALGAADDQPPASADHQSPTLPPPTEPAPTAPVRTCHRDGCNSGQALTHRFNWPGRGIGYICPAHRPWLEGVLAGLGILQAARVEPIVQAAIVLGGAEYVVPVGQTHVLRGECAENIEPSVPYTALMRMTPWARDGFRVLSITTLTAKGKPLATCPFKKDENGFPQFEMISGADSKLRLEVKIENIAGQDARFLAQVIFER